MPPSRIAGSFSQFLAAGFARVRRSGRGVSVQVREPTRAMTGVGVHKLGREARCVIEVGREAIDAGDPPIAEIVSHDLLAGLIHEHRAAA